MRCKLGFALGDVLTHLPTMYVSRANLHILYTMEARTHPVTIKRIHTLTVKYDSHVCMPYNHP